jgi:hypothetical protein
MGRPPWCRYLRGQSVYHPDLKGRHTCTLHEVPNFVIYKKLELNNDLDKNFYIFLSNNSQKNDW